MSPPPRERIRIRFAKFGRIRFTSHRDLARVWERSLRRTRLPVSYSEGYSPRPRLRFGLALATAHESCGEYLDVDLVPGTELDVDALGERLDPMLPPGVHVQAVAPVAPRTPSLQEAVSSCSWLVEVPDLDRARADVLIEQVLAAEELPVTRTRKGKDVTDDIRPSVRSLRIAEADECPPAADVQPAGVMLRAELATQPRACRPAELLQAVGGGYDEGRVLRLHQWTTVGGDRREPLEVAPWAPEGTFARPTTAHATVRAS
ncbi:MAG: TIGR03936 family radical SAM-associated protein [Acidimicrobiales bacterium]|nr:TIGR03936 family radical SAM-associated protein [Acidimicrobiales bacterium]